MALVVVVHEEGEKAYKNEQKGARCVGGGGSQEEGQFIHIYSNKLSDPHVLCRLLKWKLLKKRRKLKDFW